MFYGVNKMIKKSLGEMISDRFDIPLNGISAVPNAQLIGNTQLSIDGCVGIKKYKEYKVEKQAEMEKLNDSFLYSLNLDADCNVSYNKCN